MVISVVGTSNGSARRISFQQSITVSIVLIGDGVAAPISDFDNVAIQVVGITRGQALTIDRRSLYFDQSVTGIVDVAPLLA
ncbi:hypothetical protein D3C76_1474110 [compost metagenome]